MLAAAFKQSFASNYNDGSASAGDLMVSDGKIWCRGKGAKVYLVGMALWELELPLSR